MLFLPLVGFAQLNDNFSDGDLINNPTWLGDVSFFRVNSNQQLQLNHSEAASVYISSPCFLSDSLEWNFDIRLAFSPSSSNNARIYLMADHQNLKGDLNGYYLQFGEALGDDAIELFYQENDQIQSICRGSAGRIASSFDINIKTIFTKSGAWTVFVDWDKNGNYIEECSGTHLSVISNPYFGMYCTFTSSNATKFYFDNIQVDYIYKDLEAPVLETVEVISSKSLKVIFNEPLDANSAEDIQNYQVQESGEHPISAVLNASNPSEVMLEFSSDFTENQIQNLEVNSIADLANNTLVGANVDFFFSKAYYGDVLINEIMADPSPVQALPDAEYIELYNRMDYPVLLENWQLFIGQADFQFPKIILPEHGFLLLCHPESKGEFAKYGQVISVPSFSLTNSGKALVLKNKSNQIIHYINYSDTWYKDEMKEDGGWSLEMISSDFYCEQELNWLASQNINGGSPGSENSLSHILPEVEPPKIIAIQVETEKSIGVQFSKSMDSIALKNVQNYDADNGLGKPVQVEIFAPEYNFAQLVFKTDFEQNMIYELSVSPALLGCCGYEVQNLNKRFAMPQEAEFGDIIFNEILFNAWYKDGEYAEFYNLSDKVIDLHQLLFSRISINQYDTAYTSIQLPQKLLFPEEYLLLCKNMESVLSVYATENPEAFYVFDNFPSLNNTEGQLILSKALNKSSIIDGLLYNESMHHALLNNVQGIALERLSFTGETNDPNNWSSASSSVNYGTPGYLNSQFQQENTGEDIIQIYPEIFSPDLDGIDDILQISYQFPEGAYTLNLIIFNAQGQQIRHLVKNELMGKEGQIFWNGENETGDKSPIGIYILYFEYFDLKGKVEKIKKTCVLGGKL